MKKISLQDVNLTHVTKIEQYAKLQEEREELEEAVVENINEKTVASRKHVIEEFWDEVQAAMSYVNKMCEIDADELMTYYNEHVEKIKNRPR